MRQRYLCKKCGHQFLIEKINLERQKDNDCKRKALLLFLEGYSLRKTAGLLSISPATLIYWQKQWGNKVIGLRKKIKLEEYNVSDLLTYIESKRMINGYTMQLTDLETNVSFLCKVNEGHR